MTDQTPAPVEREKITPPPLLERAVAEAVRDLDPETFQADHALIAEAILYSEPMQAWMHGEMARYEALLARSDAISIAETLPHEGMLREPEDLVKVTCYVQVPLSSPVAAMHALGRVPIDANVRYDDKPQGLIAGIFGVGSLVATWTEER